MICQSCKNVHICKIFAAVRDSLGVADVVVNSCTVFTPYTNGMQQQTTIGSVPDFLSRTALIEKALQSKELPEEDCKGPDKEEELKAEEKIIDHCELCDKENVPLKACSVCGKMICEDCQVTAVKETVGEDKIDKKVVCSECW